MRKCFARFLRQAWPRNVSSTRKSLNNSQLLGKEVCGEAGAAHRRGIERGESCDPSTMVPGLTEILLIIHRCTSNVIGPPKKTKVRKPEQRLQYRAFQRRCCQTPDNALRNRRTAISASCSPVPHVSFAAVDHRQGLGCTDHRSEGMGKP